MQELVISNVRTTQYKDVNLNKIFDPDKQHKRCYEFQNSYVAQPSAVMPPNENGAHMLTNHSAEPLVYLDVHTISSPEVIVYPDSGNIRVMTGKMQKSYKLESEVNYLDGE